jgi:hypothetical protein
MLKRVLIFVHRWLGVAMCLLFLIWFPSAIGMMYWPYPSVTPADRLERSPVLDRSKIAVSPVDAYGVLGIDEAPSSVRLNSFDGRPVYRFRTGRFEEHIVFADTAEELGEIPMDMVNRVASAWTSQPASAARLEAIEQQDQWTLQTRLDNVQPLWKYAWPNGEQVYVSQASGNVIQYTTNGSRLGAYAGPILHWLYFTPLRRNGQLWNRLVVWSSAVGTVSASLGVIVAIWMYSPRKRYRYDGAPTSIPYRGQKRWHMVLGLIFGMASITWVFSGLLSMEPFELRREGAPVERTSGVVRIPQAFRGRLQFGSFAAKDPREALSQVANLQVKELEFTSIVGEPVYLATLSGGASRIIPVEGDPIAELDHQAIIDLVKRAAGPELAEARVMNQYDAYYLDRHRERPLPVILARLNDANQTRYYINPKNGRIASGYSAGDWIERWAYHGLHSFDFPWLYNYRPAWDIVVITFMLGGTALCVTSLVLAWRVLGRTLKRRVAMDVLTDAT